MADDPPETRRRGRPREIDVRPPGQGAPLNQRRSDYQQTSQAILAAAERIALQRGVRNLTLAAVAEDAHVDLTTVGYHFRTRNGLLAALHDLQYRDEVAAFAERAADEPTPRARMTAYFDGARRMLADTAATRAYFDILASALNDDDLRAKLAEQDEWIVTEFLRVVDGPDGSLDPRRRAVAQFIFAAVDGIELHHALSGSVFPIDEVWKILCDAVERIDQELTTGETA
ncbi:MAG: TetR family transcriptional regulator C-terminal domain-containing protein [Pseudolysinimonas sp.]